MPKSRMKIGCLLVLIILPLTLIIALLLSLFVRESVNRAELDRKLAALTADGKPIDNSSLDLFYRSAADSTDSAQWQSVFASLDSQEFKGATKGIPLFDPKVVPKSSASEPFEEPERVRVFLRSTAWLRDKVRELSLKAKPVLFPIQFDSLATLLPSTQNLRTAARLIVLEGQFAIYERDSQSVEQSIEALLGMSQVCSAEPILVSQLVCIAIDGLAMNLLREALEADVIEGLDRDRLLDIVGNPSSNAKRWRRTIAGERGFILEIFRDPSQIAGMQDNENLSFFPARSADQLLSLRLFALAENANPDDPIEFRKILQGIDDEIRSIAGGSFLGKFDSAITMLTVPALNSAGEAFLRKRQIQKLAALAIATRKFEDVHGQFPNNLEELSEFGISPSKGDRAGPKLFGYRAQDSEAIIWSVDGQNNQALPADPPDLGNEPENSINRQWVWRLPKVAKP